MAIEFRTANPCCGRIHRRTFLADVGMGVELVGHLQDLGPGGAVQAPHVGAAVGGEDGPPGVVVEPAALKRDRALGIEQGWYEVRDGLGLWVDPITKQVYS